MIPEVMSHVGKKPATISYPKEKVQMPPHFRGRLRYYPEKCIGCKLCMKDCPSNAITINKMADKVFEAVIRLDKCIYCAQCVDSCPKNALEPTDAYELAQLDRNQLVMTVSGTIPQPEPVSAEVAQGEKAEPQAE